MFSLPAIWQTTAAERNAERFHQIDERFARIESLFHDAVMRANAQRVGYTESATEAGTLDRGGVGNLAQHGGWVAQEEIGRLMFRAQELLTEIAVLSAGFEVADEPQS